MADLNIGVTIGGAVSQTFTNAMRTAERNVNSFRNNAERGGRQLGDAFRSTEQRLNRISTSAQNAGAAIGNMANAHRRASAAAQQHLTILQRLGNAVRNIRLENVVRGTTATIGAIGGAIAGGIAVNNIFNQPKNDAEKFDQIVTRILKKDNIYGESAKSELKQELQNIAKQNNLSAVEVASGYNTLIENGIPSALAKKVLVPMSKFSVAAESNTEDSARMTAALLNNAEVLPEQIEDAYAIAVAAGKAGAFEVKDMAKYAPEMLPLYKQKGISGLEAVKMFAIQAQVARRQTSSSDEAATLMRNGQEKVSDTATTNRYNTMIKKDKQLQALGFKDYQTDLMRFTQKYGDPITAQIELVKQIMEAKSGVKLDKDFQNLEKTDNKKYNAILDKVVALAQDFAVGEMFAEQRAKGNLIATLQNEAFAKELKETIENTNGKELMEKDFQAEMNSLAGIRGQKEAAATNAAISAGESMAETTKSMDTTLKSIYNLLGDFMGTSAGGVIGSVAQPLGVAGGTIGGAATGLIGAGLLTGGTQGAANTIRGIGSVGRSAMSVAGRAISSTAGRALGAVGAVGIGGYNAYQTYQNRENLTAEQQGEGYGSAVGGAGGAIAGAMVGAAVGSAVPVIGTVIGGLIGGALGGLSGDFVGGALGGNIGKAVDKNDAKAEKVQTAIIQAENTQQSGNNEPKVINNTDNSQHPVSIVTNVTVQGNADDPAKIASEIYPHIEQKIKDTQARQQANSVFDNR